MRLIASAALLALGAPALAAPAAAPAAPVITMGTVSGSTQFQLGGSDVWFFARPGRALPSGALVKTEADSSCVLLLSDGTKLRLRPRSKMRVAELTSERAAISLDSGRLEAWAKRREGAEFRIVTPMFTATLPEGILAAEILSPTSATLDIFAGDPTVVDTLGKSQKVLPGQRMELGATTGSSTPAPLPAGAVRPEEPSPAARQSVRPRPAKPEAAPKEAKPAELPAPAKPEAAPKKARHAEPPPPAKSAMDSQL